MGKINKDMKNRIQAVNEIDLSKTLFYLELSLKRNKACYAKSTSNLFHAISHVLTRFNKVKNFRQFANSGQELQLTLLLNPVVNFLKTDDSLYTDHKPLLDLFYLISHHSYPKLSTVREIFSCQ